MLAYKFVNWDVPALDTLKNTTEYILAAKLEKGDKMTRSEKNQITALCREYGHIRLSGWLFPLLSLQTFYVEQYGNVYKRRGADKTAIRATTHGKITKIVLRD